MHLLSQVSIGERFTLQLEIGLFPLHRHGFDEDTSSNVCTTATIATRNLR